MKRSKQYETGNDQPIEINESCDKPTYSIPSKPKETK